MATRRQDRLSAQIQRSAAQALAGESLSTLATVTRATISPDARHATVYLAGWNELRPDEQLHVRGAIIESVVRDSTSKYTPRIEVAHDDAPDHASRIQDLLRPDSSV